MLGGKSQFHVFSALAEFRRAVRHDLSAIAAAQHIQVPLDPAQARTSWSQAEE
jgi:hypothetical protein